jgi:hypothetical protein
VIYANVGCFVEIGNGAGDFKDPVVGPCRQTEFVNGAFKKIAGGLVNPAMFFNMPVDHLGIAVNFVLLNRSNWRALAEATRALIFSDDSALDSPIRSL